MKKIFILILSSFLLFSCSQNIKEAEKNISNQKNMTEENLENAYFAGGCFWCMEGTFESQPGVKQAIAGYIGGTPETANYEDVSSGLTKHREGVHVIYNPEIISYEKLVELFWIQIDPIDPDGQFSDKGYQYTTAIFYGNNEEKLIAENSKKALQDSKKFDKSIATKIIKSSEFFRAEEYHQDYYKKSSLKYSIYEKGSGRKDYKEETWEEEKKNIENDGLETKQELKKRLTPLQYKVTQEGGTEKAFDNTYWDNKKEGIYVDIVDGTPLFSSEDKYTSGTGWPSFSKPISLKNVVEKEDNTLFSKRTEIKGAKSDSHIGHVFDDGPEDKGGLRYCMNSAALQFIPKEDLEEEGYAEYLELFK